MGCEEDGGHDRRRGIAVDLKGIESVCKAEAKGTMAEECA